MMITYDLPVTHKLAEWHAMSHNGNATHRRMVFSMRLVSCLWNSTVVFKLLSVPLFLIFLFICFLLVLTFSWKIYCNISNRLLHFCLDFPPPISNLGCLSSPSHLSKPNLISISLSDALTSLFHSECFIFQSSMTHSVGSTLFSMVFNLKYKSTFILIM